MKKYITDNKVHSLLICRMYPYEQKEAVGTFDEKLKEKYENDNADIQFEGS